MLCAKFTRLIPNISGFPAGAIGVVVFIGGLSTLSSPTGVILSVVVTGGLLGPVTMKSDGWLLVWIKCWVSLEFSVVVFLYVR